MISPWDYQIAAIDAVIRELQLKKKPLVVSPGGSGKTVMISELAVRARKMGGGRVLIVSHRKEIIEQTAATLLKMGFQSDEVGILMGSEKVRTRAPVVVASIMTLHQSAWRVGKVDFVIIDEAHHALARKYKNTLERFNAKFYAGFTATPFRLDGKGLADFFDVMIVAAKPSELMAKDRLARPVIYRAPEEFMPDLSDIRIARGDYIIGKLAERVSPRGIVGNIVDNYKLRAKGKRAIAFGVSILHSQSIADRFNDAGVPAAHLDGTMSKDQREEVLEGFRSGNIHVLSNCMVLTEGYDLPACEAVIMARPTQSLVLYLQQAARGMRFFPGKTPILLDHARLLERFGLPEADRDYVLTTTKANRDSWSSGSVKDCPQCGAVSDYGSKVCIVCGLVFPQVERGIPEEQVAVLEVFSAKEKKELEGRLQAYAEAQGYEPEWVEQLVQLWVGNHYQEPKTA